MASSYMNNAPICIGPCANYAAGDAADNIQAFRTRHAIRVISAYLTVATTIGANASDYVTITLNDGTNTIATLDTATVALTADTPRAMTVTARLALISADTNLRLTVTQTGSTGVAVVALQADIEIETHEGASQRS